MHNGPGPAGPAHPKDRPAHAATPTVRQTTTEVALKQSGEFRPPNARTAWLALSLAFLAAAGIVAVWAFYGSAVGAHRPNVFDGAIFQLVPIYTAQGLTPYKDFGFVYPPGPALLLGGVLRVSTPQLVTSVAWGISALLATANLVLTLRLARPAHRLNLAALFLGFAAIVALFVGAMGSEPFSPWLLGLLFLAMLHLLQSGATLSRIALVVVVAIATTLVRWDRVVPVVLLLGAAAVLLRFAPALLRRVGVPIDDLPDRGQRLLVATASCGSGAVLGLFAIIAYAAARGALAETLDWLFVVPFETLPFRRLPLPPFSSLREMEAQWLTIPACLLLIIVGFFLAYRPWRPAEMARLAELALILAMPLSLVPYAFGRADGPHFFFLTIMTASVCLAALAIWRHPLAFGSVIAGGLVLAIPLIDEASVLSRRIGKLPDRDRATQLVADWTSGCTALFPEGAKSLFIGQESYDLFLINWPALYLARSDLRPASAYIVEEPGQQNACNRGEAVGRALRNAARPMVAVLDSTPGQPEPNATRTMTSCGRIEAALAAMPHRDLGSCVFQRHTLRVRLYE